MDPQVVVEPKYFNQDHEGRTVVAGDLWVRGGEVTSNLL